MSVVGGRRDEYSRDDEQRFSKVGSNTAALSLGPNDLILHLLGVEKAGVTINLLGSELPAEHVGQLGDVDMVFLLVILYPAHHTLFLPLSDNQLITCDAF